MAKVDSPKDVSETVWDGFITHRKLKRATVRETAIKKFRDEATKAGMTMQETIEVCISNGLQGFDADWMKGRTNENAAARIQGTGRSDNQRSGFGGKKSQSRLATEETERIIAECRRRH